MNTQGLLNDLNKRLEEPLPMNRFRPNIVVSDCRPAEEDNWQEYAIGKEVIVEAVKPCDRCTVSKSDCHHVFISDSSWWPVTARAANDAASWSVWKHMPVEC